MIIQSIMFGECCDEHCTVLCIAIREEDKLLLKLMPDSPAEASAQTSLNTNMGGGASISPTAEQNAI